METSTPPPKGQEAASMINLLCPYADDLKCMGTAKACQSATRRLDAHDDMGQGDMMGMIGCACGCPDLMSMMGGEDSSRRLDAHEEKDDGESMKAMCANPKGTIGCVATHGECDSMRKMLVNTMPGATDDNLMGYVG